MSASYFVIFLMAAVAAIFVILILEGRSDSRRKEEQMIHSSWGSAKSRELSPDAMQRMRDSSDAMSRDYEEEENGEPESFRIDDITADDLELDRFYQASVRTMSAPGDEVYYDYLRRPLLHPDAVDARIRLEDFFLSHEEARTVLQKCLLRVGREKNASCTDAFDALDRAEPVGRIRYLLLSALTGADIVMLFFLPLPAVLMLVPLMAVNISVHLRMKERVGKEIRHLAFLIRMQRSASDIADLPYEEILSERETLRSASAHLASLKRASFFVTSGAAVGTGIGDLLVEYAKLFFHADLIRYDGMLAAYRAHREDAIAMYRTLGRLDALISCASYIASRPGMTRPSFGRQKSIRTSGLVHPLLSDPVPVSFFSERSMLLTGSNASGKSTFLKAVALGALMAQSIGAVAASSWEAPCFRVMTSMALGDNLKNGESYFVVEIRSLKRIIDASGESGAPVLAMVDEVLRGTNTVERIAASSQILLYLSRLHVLVFAATHDIELSYLLDPYLENRHFEETVRDGDVVFDYKLRKGRASSGNAIRLLRVSGYPDKVTEDAEDSAAFFEKTGEWRIMTKELPV